MPIQVQRSARSRDGHRAGWIATCRDRRGRRRDSGLRVSENRTQCKDRWSYTCLPVSTIHEARYTPPRPWPFNFVNASLGIPPTASRSADCSFYPVLVQRACVALNACDSRSLTSVRARHILGSQTGFPAESSTRKRSWQHGAIGPRLSWYRHYQIDCGAWRYCRPQGLKKTCTGRALALYGGIGGLVYRRYR